PVPIISLATHFPFAGRRPLCVSSLLLRPPPRSTLFPYTTLFRSGQHRQRAEAYRAAQKPPARRLRQKFGRILDQELGIDTGRRLDRKSTRLNSSHRTISYAVFCLKKKKNRNRARDQQIHREQSSD